MYHDILMSAKAPEEQEAPPDRAATPRWTTAQHEGHLLMFYPTELREAVSTVQGTSDAVFCRRVVDLDTGATFEQALIFGAALVPNLKGGIPESAVCGRLTKSERGAWVLMPHSQDELFVAQKWESENLV